MLSSADSEEINAMSSANLFNPQNSHDFSMSINSADAQHYQDIYMPDQ